MTIRGYKSLKKFAQKCGTSIPPSMDAIFSPISSDKDAVRRKSVEFSIDQCEELLDAGVPGLHFYTLNKAEPTTEIVNALFGDNR